MYEYITYSKPNDDSGVIKPIDLFEHILATLEMSWKSQL